MNFQQGDTISLFTQGQCPIHLTGYLLGEDDSDDDMTLGEMMEEEGEEEEDDDEEEEEEEEEVVDQGKGNKRAMPVNGKGTYSILLEFLKLIDLSFCSQCSPEEKEDGS